MQRTHWQTFGTKVIDGRVPRQFSADEDEKIFRLWLKGSDTVAIALRIKATKAQIYNRLRLIRELRRGQV